MSNIIKHSILDDNSIFKIAKIIGSSTILTGKRLTSLLDQSDLSLGNEGTTKWRRLYDAFTKFQNEQNTCNNILLFIRLALAPSSFIDDIIEYQYLKSRTNQILAFSGFEFRDEDGKIHKVKKAGNIQDAISRSQILKSKLEHRGIHKDILRFAEEEIIYDNYFHTVLEGIKGITAKLRSASGYSNDGIQLVDATLCGNSPILIINNYKTDSEIGEQKGFANLLKGIYGTFRNPLAHEAKITWNLTEEDALDILCTVSYIYRKLDNVRRK